MIRSMRCRVRDRKRFLVAAMLVPGLAGALFTSRPSFAGRTTIGTAPPQSVGPIDRPAAPPPPNFVDWDEYERAMLQAIAAVDTDKAPVTPKATAVRALTHDLDVKIAVQKLPKRPDSKG